MPSVPPIINVISEPEPSLREGSKQKSQLHVGIQKDLVASLEYMFPAGQGFLLCRRPVNEVVKVLLPSLRRHTITQMCGYVTEVHTRMYALHDYSQNTGTAITASICCLCHTSARLLLCRRAFADEECWLQQQQ